MEKDDDRDLTPLARVMRSQKRPHVVVSFPGMPSAKVAIVVPSDEEIAEAQAAAVKFITSNLKLTEFQLATLIDRNVYENEEQRQILTRVLRDPADPEASFATDEELRRWLSPDVRKALMRYLAEWCERNDPQPKDVPLLEFIQDLKDAGALSDYLTCCDSDMRKSIALLLADQLPKRQGPSSTDTSSSSSQNASGGGSTPTTE